MEISIKSLSKKYKGNKFGLKNFNLELKTGILGLKGPNGSGKSTLMLISNFTVLPMILLVIAVMTVVMFLIRGETSQLEFGKA